MISADLGSLIPLRDSGGVDGTEDAFVRQDLSQHFPKAFGQTEKLVMSVSRMYPHPI